MNISTVVTTPSRLPHLPPQEWSHSRSHTEPLIGSPERSHQARLSIDASPRQPAIEKNILNTTPSPSRPQKKRRSTTLTSIPTSQNQSKKNPILTKSPSVPTFHVKPDPRDSESAPAVPAPELCSATVGAPLLRVPSNASTADSRSPSQRRPPASHSSYGVETSNGPPPSFTTQRTLSQDRLWKPSPPEKSNIAQQSGAGSFYDESDSPPRNIPSMDKDEVANDQGADFNQDDLDNTTTPGRQVDQSAAGQDIDTDPGTAGHSTETLCTAREHLSPGMEVQSDGEGRKNSGADDQKSDDLFLNLAQIDAGRQELVLRSKRRKSRIGTSYTTSLSRPDDNPPTEATQLPEQNQVGHDALSPRTDLHHQPNKRQSLSFRSIARSAHPLDEPGRQRYFSAGTKMHPTGNHSTLGRGDREASPELPYNRSERATNVDSGTRSYRRSNLSAFRSDRNVSTSELQERARYLEQTTARVEGTESTMSTAAPSTVWDELDELKSRIKKLELTGKLPSSSAAAMSPAERPRTATTTITTMSSSPKRGKANSSPDESGIDGVSLTVHPLLHEAVQKARPMLSADIYQKLEATASDALQLASVMGAGLHPGSSSVIGASSSAERQLRRRADSMCRGLTELAIALSAGPNPPTSLHPFRPSSRGASSNPSHTTPPTTSYSLDSASRFSRRLSIGPEDARPSAMARAQSRLESRRASLLHNSMSNSPQENTTREIAIRTPSVAQPQNQMQPNSSSRLNRAATRLRGQRAAGAVDGVDDSENEHSPSVRPVSRARTEVSLRHRSARDRTSIGREYTSSHPLPSFVRKGNDIPADASPSVIASSGLPTCRSYAPSTANVGSSNLNSPTTPKDNIQPVYRRRVSNGATREASSYFSSTEHTPENVTVQRSSASGSRRSLGLTSRLGQVGNFMNGRLRAAKMDRERQESLQSQQKTPSPQITRQHSRQDQEKAGVY
ncbi:hypothetical protein EPUS_07504 [Endocarpon pusillum Z07020]|uniref:LPXTG-motif cell wall anchor domain protein n=1 Tax=Endocarpon pusillum (strain Z07020 / HMAS-L-300199) TaxID=1263415 RepID=U1HSP6_ENDPU|nr:uncharacterized protein EPUS_07504 [Endocarpon pusillum Z07020]ERF73570.1 hypothetical protein EPUS_07504 [Endocarpon pusillum Z07020]